jgi:hypothetical protein
MPINDEDQQPTPSTGRRPQENALQLGPRKKPWVLILTCYVSTFSLSLARCISDPLVHHGRHFGRTVHALCSLHALITNGLLRDGERADEPEESFTAECILFLLSAYISLVPYREQREYRVYRSLLNMIPGLEERLVNSSDEETRMIADLVGGVIVCCPVV